ncbi:hypothetical protein DFH08DRAFT_822148 [Mycena albidolilacea]|uniref:Cysteine protease n=1 Tax=Mycena albidolilacea TaxID=1033008 RepID=A0AAD6Z9E2_9AGAR|nr:hypothetical protein DFH08DRAFT_822148 [Mycena albidolilacea]
MSVAHPPRLVHPRRLPHPRAQLAEPCFRRRQPLRRRPPLTRLLQGVRRPPVVRRVLLRLYISFALHLRLASNSSSGGTQHSEQHELVRTGRRARSQHGGYLANGGEAARVGPGVRGARHGGGVYIHSTSSPLDIGQAPPALVLHLQPRRPPRVDVVHVPRGLQVHPRPPVARLAPSQSDSPSSAGHSSHTHSEQHELAAVALEQHEPYEEVMGARRDGGVDERCGVGVYAKDGTEFVGDEFGRVGDPTRNPAFSPPTPDARRFRRARATALLVPPRALRAVRRAPHGVAGKVAGKDVGMWFGPSAASYPARRTSTSSSFFSHPHSPLLLSFSRPAPSPHHSLALPPGRDSPSLLALKTDYVTSAYPHPSFPFFVLPSISPTTPGVNKTSIIDVFPFLSLAPSSPTAPSVWRMLVDAFPACGMGVYAATDGALPRLLGARAGAPLSSIFGVLLVARPRTREGDEGRKTQDAHVGGSPVLLLLGIRLRPDGVNPGMGSAARPPPVWRMTSCAGFRDVAMLLVREPRLRVLVALMLYTLPQSVGLAGGRPSSSYYFVGVEGDGLFYLDPNHLRPAVPLRPFVPRLAPPPPSTHSPRQITTRRVTARMSPPRAAHSARDVRARGSTNPEGYARAGSMSSSLSPGTGTGRARVLTLLAAPARHQPLGRLPARCRAAASRQASPARGGGALRARAQPGRAAYLPLRAGAQDAAVGARPGHAHWIRVSRLGGVGTFAEG